ncbi:phosphotransferase [Tepidibacillus marianensis]|uniref:phosphotransferase n=1 Tax=Tepidibacillus marianensis TaxID=3131995 RepID=UPI0030D06AA8
MEEQIAYSLIKEYGIHVNRVERFRHLWKVYSPYGIYVVKAYPNDVRLIKWQTYLFDQVRKKGFAQLNYFLANQRGTSWFGDMRYPFVVMPFLDGEIASYTNQEQVEKVVNVLARFHHQAAWIGVEVQPKHRVIRTERLTKRLQEFEQLYQIVEQKRVHDPLDQEIISIGKKMIQFGKEAIYLLDQDKMNRLYREAVEYRMVSHRDVANHNFLLGEKVWMIDFDLSGYEAQVLDLWQMVNRIMVDWSWNLDTFVQVEKKYHQIRKLSDSERTLLRQLSLYPNEFFRECLGAYYRPDKYKKDHVLPYIQRFHREMEIF